jgi:AcrR family transcriptional regulator
MQHVTPPARKAGRPPRRHSAEDALPTISREVCIARAYELCDEIDIQKLSLTLLAGAVGVSPTTIRHHLRNRKALTPALFELFFSDVAKRFPPLTGDWQADLEGFMMTYMSVKLRKRGFAAYFFEHRFSKELDPFASAPAKAVVGRALHVMRSAGLSTRDAALAWHLMVHLLSSIAYTNARGLTPADHASFFETMARRSERADDDRTVISALQFITMPMMFEVISGMLKHAVSVKFEFSPTATVKPARKKSVLS